MNYTEEQRAADAEIAVAMGVLPEQWQSKCIADYHSLDEDAWCYDCNESIGKAEKVPPRFHADDSARRALLEWLYNVRGSETFCRMLLILEEIIEGRPEGSGPPVGAPSVPKLMLATPAQVAAAALRVLKEGE